ncbi:hypothetical protein VHEMI10717 [[Torrubiella] hemipterigena]|uniref:Reverse transcriptase n=1 Tax=[Torrubiella] hemipterigena TaxID=1531966 RepID=A0A0A1TSQ3_9HYPO|nr:hypothetical protein VHEMI10717 [[Torrubiella] hemipterigena]
MAIDLVTPEATKVRTPAAATNPIPISKAQAVLLQGRVATTHQPFPPSSSPMLPGPLPYRGRSPKRNRPDYTSNIYHNLADELDNPGPIDIEQHAESVLTKEMDRLQTRTEVLRTFATVINDCAKQYTKGYALQIARDFSKSLLIQWDNFVRQQPGEQKGIYPKDNIAVKLHKPAANISNPGLDPRPAPAGGWAARAAAADGKRPGDIEVRKAARTDNTPRTQPAKLDKRILLRIKHGSELFNKHGYQIRLALAQAASIDPKDIQDIKPTNTGWAITARTLKAEETLLSTQESWGPKFDLIIAEKNVQWHTYLVKNFPRTLTDWEGAPLDFDQVVSDEIHRQTRQTPIAWHISKADTLTDSRTVTLVISFSEPVLGNFRLLGTSAFSFKLTKAPKITQCTNCWNYHAPTRCIAPEICKNCGQRTGDNHKPDSCTRFTQCALCHGPHPPDDNKCFAKPKKREDGLHKLLKTQRVHAKLLGSQAFRQIHREDILSSSPNGQASSAPPSPTPGARTANL